MNRIIISSLFILAPLIGICQSTPVNVLNENGEKDGLWIEMDGLIEAYYKNGAKHGIWKAYSRNTKKLRTFGQYQNDFMVGTWYYFDENSKLILSVCNIERNLKYTRIDDSGIEVKPTFTSYLTFYHPNGVIKAEGRVLYWDEIEIDYYEDGTWKYYDTTGAFIRTTEY